MKVYDWTAVRDEMAGVERVHERVQVEMAGNERVRERRI